MGLGWYVYTPEAMRRKSVVVYWNVKAKAKGKGKG